MRRMKSWLLAACVCGLAIPALAADTLETVEKALFEKNDKLKSLSATMTTKMSNDSMKMDMDGTLEWMRKDGKTYSRSQFNQKTSLAGQPAQESKILAVSDGQFLWTQNESAGQKMVTKSKMDNQQAQFGREAWEQMKKEWDLKLAGEEKIEGKDTWVVEGTPKKKEMAASISKMKMWYDKDTGVSIKQVTYDAAGKENTVTVMKDVKVNTDLPMDRFTYKAPEGVQVMDLTNMGGASGGSAAGGDKPAEPKDAPKEEPKKEEPKKEEPKKEEPKKPGVDLPKIPKP